MSRLIFFPQLHCLQPPYASVNREPPEETRGLPKIPQPPPPPRGLISSPPHHAPVLTHWAGEGAEQVLLLLFPLPCLALSPLPRSTLIVLVFIFRGQQDNSISLYHHTWLLGKKCSIQRSWLFFPPGSESYSQTNFISWSQPDQLPQLRKK